MAGQGAQGWESLKALLTPDEIKQTDWTSLPPFESWCAQNEAIASGNRRDLNRLRALALGHTQPALQVRTIIFF